MRSTRGFAGEPHCICHSTDNRKGINHSDNVLVA